MARLLSLLLASLKLASLPVVASDGKPEGQEERPVLYRENFAKKGNAPGPIHPDNRCFKFGELEIPHENLPQNVKLVLTMRVYCETFGRPPEWDPKGPGHLQLDVISEQGNHRISQCRFKTGKEWITARIHFTVNKGTKQIAVYNKWTNEPVYVDNVTIQLADEKPAKQ